MPAAPCCPWPSTAATSRPRSATSPSAQAFPSPTWNRYSSLSRVPAWCVPSGAWEAGYVLARQPEKLTLGQVVAAVDGPIVVGRLRRAPRWGRLQPRRPVRPAVGLGGGGRAHAGAPRLLHHRRHGPPGGRSSAGPRGCPVALSWPTEPRRWRGRQDWHGGRSVGRGRPEWPARSAGRGAEVKLTSPPSQGGRIRGWRRATRAAAVPAEPRRAAANWPPWRSAGRPETG